MDLDRPDPVPEAGDAGAPDPLLAAAARRLETCLRSGDAPASLGHEYLVSRLGGDQFGILIEGLAEVGEASVAAQRVLSGMLASFSLGGAEVFVKASVGVAVSVTGYRRGEDVLRDADTALHRARALGKGRCEVFDTALLDSARSRLEMEAELEKAIERREFVLFYQPIVSLSSNRIAGLEALVRWQHPTRGLVPPMEFIPLAEKTGAIGRIGAWVVREACRQLSAWRSTLPIPRDLWVSVNLSSVQFRDPSLFEQISLAVRDAALDPRCLMVELTEGTVMENPAAARGLVMQLRVLGVRVGLDDFGTGHSALSYLHQFPADFLKVDRSFIRGLDSRRDMAEIVRTVNDLADRLGLEVIAEGIERDEQLTMVRTLRCGYVQGFLLARPVDHERAAALLAGGLEMPDTLQVPDGQGTEAATTTPAAKGGAWGWRSLSAAAAAVVLLVSAGLVVRVASGARTAPAPGHVATTTALPARTEPAPPVVTPAAAPPTGAGAPDARGAAPTAPSRPDGVPRSSMPAAGASPGRAAGTAAKAMPLEAGPSVETFPVVHLHAIGKCTGQLIVTPSGVSFVADKSKDGFALPYRSFLATLSDGALVIKSDKRTYRFKTSGGAGALPPVQAVYDSITRQSQ